MKLPSKFLFPAMLFNHSYVIPIGAVRNRDSMQITSTPLFLIRSCLQYRKKAVNIYRYYSKERATNIGVPQGSTLGPLLFLAYINYLPSCLTPSKCTLYADDITTFNSNNCVTTQAKASSTKI